MLLSASRRLVTLRSHLSSARLITTMPRVIPVRARTDNNMYIIAAGNNKAVAVDPYDVSNIADAAKAEGLEFVAVLTTHHHDDHAGGNKAFVERFGVPVYGGSSQIAALTHPVTDESTLSLGDLDIKCIHTPCHTQDSICYLVTDRTQPNRSVVFTGDTLFIGGCGRFFEGTAAEMDTALSKLGALPAETVVFDGHEYTAGNVAFARSVDPKNAAISKLEQLIQTGPAVGRTTIGDEKQWNVFMRLESESVLKATGETGTSHVMDKLRDMKNNFRG
ncbi:hydroxyacylglutathione hydrolase [Auriculariales sp. MPI-PUGE-AT-0066]|nr:hydroxyacylglutathione hydrolase [Auriculariales sp. MPI-PUGE-AT-0066]